MLPGSIKKRGICAHTPQWETVPSPHATNSACFSRIVMIPTCYWETGHCNFMLMLPNWPRPASHCDFVLILSTCNCNCRLILSLCGCMLHTWGGKNWLWCPLVSALYTPDCIGFLNYSFLLFTLFVLDTWPQILEGISWLEQGSPACTEYQKG